MFLVCLLSSFEYFRASAKASSKKQWNAYAFNSFIFTLLWENRKRALVLSDAAAEITELGEAELLDSLILINVVSGISVVLRSLGHF